MDTGKKSVNVTGSVTGPPESQTATLKVTVKSPPDIETGPASDFVILISGAPMSGCGVGIGTHCLQKTAPTELP
jgi:hypothetical protein